MAAAAQMLKQGQVGVSPAQRRPQRYSKWAWTRLQQDWGHGWRLLSPRCRQRSVLRLRSLCFAESGRFQGKGSVAWEGTAKCLPHPEPQPQPVWQLDLCARSRIHCFLCELVQVRVAASCDVLPPEEIEASVAGFSAALPIARNFDVAIAIDHDLTFRSPVAPMSRRVPRQASAQPLASAGARQLGCSEKRRCRQGKTPRRTPPLSTCGRGIFRF